MKVKTFWTILIKIIGIWLVLSSLSVILQLISAIWYSYHGNESAYWQVTGILLLTVAMYCFILWLFVFKTEWLISKLHLERGFEEETIDINISVSTILKIAIIVVGGLMFLDSLPQLCRQVFTYFQIKSMLRDDSGSGVILFYSVKTVIGYFLMTNSKPIVAFIEKQTANKSEEGEG